jgi:hypothetical protein
MQKTLPSGAPPFYPGSSWERASNERFCAPHSPSFPKATGLRTQHSEGNPLCCGESRGIPRNKYRLTFLDKQGFTFQVYMTDKKLEVDKIT